MAEPVRGPARGSVDWPPVWLAGFALGARILGFLAPVPVPGGWGPVLGMVVVVAALVLMGAAAVQMALARTTLIPRQAPSALVTGGVFRLSRNPIYLADVLLLVGLILSWDALLSLMLVPAFVWVIQERFIRGEEERLLEAFGDDYLIYCATVRRWI